MATGEKQLAQACEGPMAYMLRLGLFDIKKTNKQQQKNYQFISPLAEVTLASTYLSQSNMKMGKRQRK